MIERAGKDLILVVTSDQQHTRWAVQNIPDDAVCSKCKYPPRGLPRPLCPECGTEYDPGNPTTYALEEKAYWTGVRWGGRLSIVLPCSAAYLILCAAQEARWHDSFWLQVQGVLLLYGFGVGETVAAVVFALVCAGLVVAHPLVPRRATAILTAAGFLLWFIGGRLAMEMIASV